MVGRDGIRCCDQCGRKSKRLHRVRNDDLCPRHVRELAEYDAGRKQGALDLFSVVVRDATSRQGLTFDQLAAALEQLRADDGDPLADELPERKAA
jgi:hypothetical protein